MVCIMTHLARRVIFAKNYRHLAARHHAQLDAIAAGIEIESIQTLAHRRRHGGFVLGSLVGTGPEQFALFVEHFRLTRFPIAADLDVAFSSRCTPNTALP